MLTLSISGNSKITNNNDNVTNLGLHNKDFILVTQIPRFDGSAPHYCFDWLEQTEALSNQYPDRNYREELLFNCGDSVSKTIHAVPAGATNQ